MSAFSPDQEYYMSLPGNLLLLGEYHILQKNSYALSCATKERAYAHYQPTVSTSEQSKNALTLIFLWEKERLEISLKDILNALKTDDKVSLLWQKIFAQLSVTEQNIIETEAVNYAASLTFDTRELNNDHKIGLGSSALFVSLSVLMLRTLAGSALPTRYDMKCQLAHQICSLHDEFQGKKGSGYDVFTSFFGGLGFYQQRFGEKSFSTDTFTQEWTALKLNDGHPLKHLLYYSHNSQAHTPRAIQSFRDWVKENEAQYQSFYQKYEQKLKLWRHDFLQMNEDDIRQDLQFFQNESEMLAQGLGLGSSIPDELKSQAQGWKSSGAGDELFWLADVFSGGFSSDMNVVRFSVDNPGLLIGRLNNSE